MFPKGLRQPNGIIAVPERNEILFMNKRVFNILSIVLLVAVFLFVFSSEIYATSWTDRLFGYAENFLDKGEASAKIKVDDIAKIISPIASILLGIGTVVLVVVTAVMGVKYMAASPEERGKLKGQLVGIAVSAFVLFGAYGIWRMAYLIMSELT